MNGSVVNESIGTARRTVLLAFAVSAAIIGLLAVDRVGFEERLIQATDETRRAAAINDDIFLADERLTMSANMAAATGEPKWVARYEENIPVIDQAIADAKRLAPKSVAERFDRETRVANDLLVTMERRAFELEREGKLVEARAILDGPDYAKQKRILAEGSDRLSRAVVRFAESRLEGVRFRAQLFTLSLLLAAAAGFILLWRSLNSSLERSREAYLESELRIQRLAMHDLLTGLPNRQNFNYEMKSILAASRLAGRKVAIVMFDLDRFKPINDRFGHGVGDRVLAEIGKLLSDALRAGETCARLGGDEFVVAVPVDSIGDGPYLAAERLMNVLSMPIDTGGSAHTVGASAGVAVYPDHGEDVEELIRKADVALYSAKREQKGGIRLFEDAMDDLVRHRARSESDLRRAIESNEIVPYFQPVVNLKTGDIESFEVLARWEHPSRGTLLPASFIQTAEDFGLIDELFLSLLRQASDAASSWPRAVILGVNISPSQLGQRSLAERILEILTKSGLPPSALELEITETALLNNLDRVTQVVWFLKDKGVRLSLDDFGTGYSSFRHLRDLPFDRIKIDGSFVSAMTTDPDTAAIVNAIIVLGRNFNLPAVGEWIEDEATALALKEAGCAAGQGWYFGRPIPAPDVDHLLRAEAQPQKWRAVA